jgi:uncharacterized protein YaiI (UPF0178 family)
MQIWIDADACPVVIKEILYKAADRRQVLVTLVANQALSTPPSAFIKAIQVSSGFDVADDEIVRLLHAGDLVITSDIPLAAEAINKGALVLTPRGELLNHNNIGPRLTMRDFLETMRSGGIDTPGPPALNQNDRKKFADQLDQWLTKNISN